MIKCKCSPDNGLHSLVSDSKWRAGLLPTFQQAPRQPSEYDGDFLILGRWSKQHLFLPSYQNQTTRTTVVHRIKEDSKTIIIIYPKIMM